MITMGQRVTAIVLIFLALAAGFSGLAFAINGNTIASNSSIELRQLLLDGKTASAISAHKTAVEVQSLLTDHAASVQQQRELAKLVSGIERHLDVTITRAVDGAALKVAREFGKP